MSKLFGNTGSGRYSGKHSGKKLPEPQHPEQERIEDLPVEDIPLDDLPEEQIPMDDIPTGDILLDEFRIDEAPKKERTVPKADGKKKGKKKKKKKKSSLGLKLLTVLLALILFIECAYCVCIFTDIPFITKWRNIYISTAMATMNHQWLATALIPGDIVQPIIDEMEAQKENQMNIESNWGSVTEETEPVETRSPSVGFSKDQAAAILSDLAAASGLTGDASDFFELFHELDEESTYAYVEKHPEIIENGWDNFYVNEAGLDDEGTEIYTKAGDQVLAVNAEHGLLAIRITGDDYRGVLVIGKDPSRVKLAPSKYFGSMGQHAGEIAEANDALVAMTASGFGGAEGVGEGGDMTGAAMHSGKRTGYSYPWGYKRVELHTDNRLYITDSYKDFSDDCTDASEWTPALIVDGEIVVSAADNYTEMNPRACLGQTKDEAMMFLVIEGRRVGISMGTDTMVCADILARYDCYQAMNVDGGTSAILYYEGEYITLCSNANCPEGRNLPNVWVYCRDTVPDPD